MELSIGTCKGSSDEVTGATMLFHSVTEEDVVRRNCLAKSCPYCVRNSLLEDQNHSIVS